jgi:hypothetical protein
MFFWEVGFILSPPKQLAPKVPQAQKLELAHELHSGQPALAPSALASAADQHTPRAWCDSTEPWCRPWLQKLARVRKGDSPRVSRRTETKSMLERSKLAPRAGVEYQNARRRPYHLLSTGPKSIAEELKPASPEPSPAPSTPSWSGQFDQDRWVAEDVYSSMRDGYFVELGANNGLLYSNTVELERRYGWRGLCIEASWSKFAELQANRPLCTNLFAIVAADDTTVVKEVLVDDTEDPFATGQLTEYKRVADGAPVSEGEVEREGRLLTSHALKPDKYNIWTPRLVVWSGGGS